MERWIGKSRDGTYYKIEGNPSLRSDFRGYTKTGRIREATILVGDELIYLRKIKGTQIDSVICTTGCKRARTPVCRCSCGGKNHGIDNRDIPGSIQAEDVIWVGS